MARFAAKCIDQMAMLSMELEATLGPGTSDLKLRVGLNVSAPIPPIHNAHTSVLFSSPDHALQECYVEKSPDSSCLEMYVECFTSDCSSPSFCLLFRRRSM